MATQTIEKKTTRTEFKAIEHQLFDILVDGNGSLTDLICPRCGNHLIFTEMDTSHMVTCETEGCISYALRGI